MRFAVDGFANAVVQGEHHRGVVQQRERGGALEPAVGVEGGPFRDGAFVFFITLFGLVNNLYGNGKFGACQVEVHGIGIVEGVVHFDGVAVQEITLVELHHNAVGALEMVGAPVTDGCAVNYRVESGGDFAHNDTGFPLQVLVKLQDVVLGAAAIKGAERGGLLPCEEAVEGGALERAHEDHRRMPGELVKGLHLLLLAAEAGLFGQDVETKYDAGNKKQYRYGQEQAIGPLAPLLFAQRVEEQGQHRHGGRHRPVGLGVPLEGHHPEEEQETGDGEDAGPFEQVSAFALFPAKPEGQGECHGIKHQQLVGDIFQGECPLELTVACDEVVAETREVVLHLPEQMGREEQQGEGGGAPHADVAQQAQVGEQHEGHHQQGHIFAV